MLFVHLFHSLLQHHINCYTFSIISPLYNEFHPYITNFTPMVRLSENFSLEEFVKTNFKVDNIPTEQAISHLTHFCLFCLEPLRLHLGDVPIYISSGFRSPMLNSIVGGSPTSQHLTGEACDIVRLDPILVSTTLRKFHIPYDQLIVYDDFIHLSYSCFGPNRKENHYLRGSTSVNLF